MSVTIKDIAKEANVSYSTVSKALNNSPLVKEVTKQKILRVAKEMGYEPNLAAKQLVRKKTEVVGLIWPTIERIVLATLVTNISKAFESTRYSMILSVDSTDTAMETFKKFQVDGMIVFAESENMIPEENIPLVAYGVSGKTKVTYPIIDANHEQAMEKAVQYLYDLGHRHIAYVGLMNTDDALQNEKVEGYQKAIKKIGLTEQSIATDGLDWFDGYLAVDDVLHVEKRPTAIIGSSYDISSGILRALQEKGLGVPDDISLISYDNIPQMETTEIPMTCIGVPVDELAEEIVQAIIERIESEEKDVIKKLHPSLTERQSAGPVPEDVTSS
ncbi:LacI family DNA-binding transcriptional regulator [Gracilibacillus salitolerans]|uniref:LacI family DNA-binding transcriptional regulator n=1 Tax=Gracilibacillus salitolerans TaxID=2663022 RepID=A0A5Q2TNH7_9BACI|nr:LacI family DNA-binding transcriptional regulator [Gracilibacillus salitolerans]QGH36539.1 LacI family DNA-binding transcriptional regulator [Gracilibacillus salitolerans]